MLFRLFIIIIQNAVHLSAILIARKCIQLYAVQSSEHIVFDLRIVFLQFSDQQLGFQAFGKMFILFGRILRKMAGTLNERKVIGLALCFDIIFLDPVHRADQFHTGKVLTVAFRYNCLQLR